MIVLKEKKETNQEVKTKRQTPTETLIYSALCLNYQDTAMILTNITIQKERKFKQQHEFHTSSIIR